MQTIKKNTGKADDSRINTSMRICSAASINKITNNETGETVTGIHVLLKEPTLCDSSQAGHFRLSAGSYHYYLEEDIYCPDDTFEGMITIQAGCNKIKVEH